MGDLESIIDEARRESDTISTALLKLEGITTQRQRYGEERGQYKEFLHDIINLSQRRISNWQSTSRLHRNNKLIKLIKMRLCKAFGLQSILYRRSTTFS